MTAFEADARFAIPEILHFEDTPGGLVRAVVTGPQADATVYLQGAHATSWTPRGGQPVLFTSSRSRFEPGIPIRGGVPIIFPWFGPRSDGLSGPMHGFARIVEWTLESTRLRADGTVEMNLSLAPGGLSRAAGYDFFQVRFRIAFGAALEMEMEVHNQSAEPIRFEAAFHTYFAIGAIDRVSVTGLDGTTYVDKTRGSVRGQWQGPIRFIGETDQVHLNTASTCQIDDTVLRRSVMVEKAGSDTTVVWNPWIGKTRTLADMAPDDWQTMLCVESANALDNTVLLPGGGVHRMRAIISQRTLSQ